MIDFKRLREEAVEDAADIAQRGIEAMRDDPRRQHPSGWILPNHVAMMAAQIYAAKVTAAAAQQVCDVLEGITALHVEPKHAEHGPTTGI